MINKGCQYVDNFLTYYNNCNFFYIKIKYYELKVPLAEAYGQTSSVCLNP